MPPARIAAASAACKEESPLPVPAAPRWLPLSAAAAPGIFYSLKVSVAPLPGSIINKRPARIKRGRLRDTDSLRVFYTLTFFDSLQTLYFQCLQQSACIKMSLQRIKMSLQRIKMSLRVYQNVTAEIFKQIQ